MKNLLALVALSLLILSGCKLEHSSRVKQSDLQGEFKVLEAMAKIEIPSCTDHKDKTKPSDSFLKTHDVMAKLFPDAAFDECKRENMDSVAVYTVPMTVGTLPPDAQSYEPQGISLIRNRNGIVFFALSKAVQEEIASGRKDALTKNLSLKINIRLANDTDSDAKIFPYAVFVGGDAFAGLPQWNHNVLIPPKGSAAITLSDVASEFVIKNGIVPVYREASAESGAGD